MTHVTVPAFATRTRGVSVGGCRIHHASRVGPRPANTLETCRPARTRPPGPRGQTRRPRRRGTLRGSLEPPGPTPAPAGEPAGGPACGRAVGRSRKGHRQSRARKRYAPQLAYVPLWFMTRHTLYISGWPGCPRVRVSRVRACGGGGTWRPRPGGQRSRDGGGRRGRLRETGDARWSRRWHAKAARFRRD